MSSQNIGPTVGATGTFATLRTQATAPAQGGEVAPTSGKAVPAEPEVAPNLEAVTRKLNSQSQAIGRDLRFKVDTASGVSVIQVLDRETGEIIREIPPEKAELTLIASGLAELRLYDGRE